MHEICYCCEKVLVMEIFLLFLAIGLIASFFSYLKNKLGAINSKLYEISFTLEQLKKSAEKQREEKEKTSYAITKEDITQKAEMPIKPVEEAIAPTIEEQQLAFEQELNAVIATINESRTEPIEETEPNEEPINLFATEGIEQENEEPIIEKTWYEKIDKNNDWEKFIGENLISKIGIAILVLGIAFFVKYAIDQNWINEVARVGIGVLAGGIILGVAHKLRADFKAFSTVLVAGGITTFYFTIGLAFQEYQLFSQTVAFAIMLVITAFSVFISIGYDRQELAVLSIIGGFATPFIVSTGSGNYVVLFTYIIILDLGMLILAFIRKWTLVNVITYVFTVLLYLAWLLNKGLSNHPEFLVNALVFATAFYVIFIAMNIAYNLKFKRNFESVDFSILLSNTAVYYGAGIALLSQYKPEWKGAFTLVLAASNCLLAWFIIKNSKADKRLLYVLIGLALTFITLAAPIQLEGNHITLFWAAEGALLLWLGQKSNMPIFRITSVVTYILAFVSLLMDWNLQYGLIDDLPILLNSAFLTNVFMGASIYFSIFLLKKEGAFSISWYEFTYNSPFYLKVQYLVFILLLYFTGFLELSYQLNRHLNVTIAVHSIVGFYHLLFTSIAAFFILRQQKSSYTKTVQFLGLANLFLYLIYLNNLPFNEIGYNRTVNSVHEVLMLNTPSNWAFLFHYLLAICMVYQTIVLYKLQYNDDSNTISRKVLYWSLVVLITYFTSSEVILHVLKLRLPAFVISTDEVANFTDEVYSHLYKQTIKVFLPVLWGILAFIFLWFGIKNQIKHLRIAALYLLGLTLLKLFVYDIREVSEGGKILAFILLGIVLLVISFMYQKIKAIIIDEPKANTHEEVN